MRGAAALAGLLQLLPALATASILHRGNGPEPSTLDAHRCTEVACGNILRDLYEGLVAEDAAGQVIPGLAESWQLSDDGLHWRFVLRERLRWSNGEDLDAGQIVASFRRALDPATAAPGAAWFDAIAGAAALRRGEASPESLGVRAPDPRTVEFVLERPAPLLSLLRLPLAYPVHLPGVAVHGSAHTRPGNLVSNGAYALRDWILHAHLTLEANPHFRAPPPIARVRFHVTEDAASELKRFAAGDLHITETVPPGRLESLRARFPDALRVAPYTGSFFLGFNLERGPFAGQGRCPAADSPAGAGPCSHPAAALREALSLALDRDILVRHVTGMGEPPAFGLVPPGLAGYEAPRPAWADWSQTEREALARRRYAEAGYGAQQPLAFELRYNTSTAHRRVALAAAAMWRAVLGAQVRLRNEEWKVFVQNRRQRVLTEVFRGGWIADYDDPLDFLQLFASDSAQNWSGLLDPDFDSLLDAARRAPTQTDRNALLQQAEARLLASHALLPLYVYTAKHLVHPDLEGFEPNLLDRHPSRFLRWREGAR
jgi:oligopeptide transport system substrate-binding protein